MRNNMLPQKFYDTNSLRNYCDGSTHFFDASTMRFFSSRIGQNAYPTTNPYKTLFVTSEQFIDGRGNAHRRLYTVRCYDCRDHDITTVGEFQAYANARAANNAAKELAPTIEYSIDDQQEYALAINEEYDRCRRRALSRGDNQFVLYELNSTSGTIYIR